MSIADYIARVIYFYSKCSVKLGTIEFDCEKYHRFVVKDSKGRSNMAYPGDGVHCGDIYIIRDTDNNWKIVQCELVDGWWKLLGSTVDEDTGPVPVLYVSNTRLEKEFHCDAFKEYDDLGPISKDVIEGICPKVRKLYD